MQKSLLSCALILFTMTAFNVSAMEADSSEEIGQEHSICLSLDDMFSQYLSSPSDFNASLLSKSNVLMSYNIVDENSDEHSARKNITTSQHIKFMRTKIGSACFYTLINTDETPEIFICFFKGNITKVTCMVYATENAYSCSEKFGLHAWINCLEQDLDNNEINLGMLLSLPDLIPVIKALKNDNLCSYCWYNHIGSKSSTTPAPHWNFDGAIACALAYLAAYQRRNDLLDKHFDMINFPETIKADIEHTLKHKDIVPVPSASGCIIF